MKSIYVHIYAGKCCFNPNFNIYICQLDACVCQTDYISVLSPFLQRAKVYLYLRYSTNVLFMHLNAFHIKYDCPR